MARPITAAKSPAPRQRRRWLLGGSALCGASLVFAVAAQAQTLPGIPAAAAIVFATGGALPVITKPDANTLNVVLNANRTVINWDSFHVSAADAVTYNFGATSDIVLNKSPTAIQIDNHGHVTGLVGAASGGNIWFYSPGGVVISPGAVMTAGNFVFARGDAIVDADFVDAASPLSVLRAASDSLIQIDTITLATGASISATGDLVLTASTGDLNATTALAAGTATVSATTGAVTIGEVTAGGTATVTAPAGAISLGQLNGASVSATGFTIVSVTAASASSLSGDIVLNGGTSASLGSGTAGRDIKVLGPAASLGAGAAGDSVFVTATTGAATVSGVVTAGNDIEITATTGSVLATGATLTATGSGATDDAHVLAQSTAGSVSVGSATTQGTGAAAGDITINGATGATLGSGHSSQDLKVLGPTASLGSGSAAREVFVTATTGAASVTGAVLAGDDIEVTATTGAVTATTGSLTAGGAGAVGDAHVLVQSTGGSVSIGSAATQGTGAAAGDITVSGATTASLGAGNSSQDIKVLGPAATLGSGSAARDVYVTGTTGVATVSGVISAGDDIEVTATTGSVAGTGASLTSTGAGAVGDAHVLARSTGGSVSLTSAATQGTGGAAGDVTVDGATGATLGSGNSSHDIKVLGPSAGLGSGSAARDVFVTATTGSATVTGQVVAGDDIEVTATTGSVAAGGADLKSNATGAVGDAHVLAQSGSGAVSVGSATTQGTGAAAGDITVSGATTASLGSGASSHDLKVLGPSASLGSGSAAGSVFVTATTGSATVTGAVTAGNDIEVTATTGAVATSGASMTATGAGAADDAHVLLQSTGGAVTAGSAATQGTGAAIGDVTIAGSTTAAVTGTINSARDVQITAGDSVVATGSTIRAVRDIAISATTGNVTLGSVSAGDDIAIRALSGAVTASGDLQSGQTQDPADPDPSGAADTLVGSTLSGHDIDIKAQTIAITGNVAAGRAPDVNETLGAAQVASTLVAEATNPDPTPATAALQLATGPGKSVTAHSDISLKTENAAASSIRTGDVSAGGDVAVDSAAGNITMASALAGDDVVLRALSGAISVSGNVESGRDSPGMTPTDSVGAGDALNAAKPFSDFDGNPATVFSVVGFDVNIISQAVHVGGAAIAGRQPSTDAPNLAGPVDATTSDVRIETRVSATPVAGLDPNISLGSAIATRDMQIDSAKAISTGALIAGRDIAVLGRGAPTPGAAPGDHTGAGTTIGSEQAGDDALSFSIYGRTHILGGVTSGAPILRLVPTNDRNIDGATEAADQLAIYLHYFDLDDASAPYVLPGSVIHIVGQGVTVGGALSAHGVGSDIRILSSLDIGVTGAVNAGGMATFQTQPGGGGVTVGAVTAAGDLFLDGGGTGTGVLAGGTLTSTNGQVAIRARDGTAISLGTVSAGDDVVIRGTAITGAVNAGGGGDAVGLGDALVASDGALTLAGHAYDLTGGNVDIIAGSVTTSATLASVGDVRIQTTGAVSLSDLTAGRDVLVDAGSTVLAGVLSATRDIAVRSRGAGASVTLGNASAGDDLVIRAKGSIFATGTLTSGGGADSAAGDQAGDLIFGADPSNLGGNLNLTGRTIDVRSSAGAITVTARVNAATDARFQTGATTGGSVTVADVTAGRSVLLDGGGAGLNGVLASGTVTATSGDVAVRARDGSAISLADVSAGDDVVLRATGAITVSGAVNAGGGSDSVGLGDALVTSEGAVTLEGHAYDLTGHNVDIVGGSVTTIGAVTATGDVRFQSVGALNLGALTAGRDVLVDGASTVLTGVLSAGRDVGVRSTGDGASVTIGAASAGDDVVIRAKGSIFVLGALSAGGGTDSTATDQAGDLMFGAAKSNLGADLDLVGQSVDVRSSAGSISVLGAVTAATDARFQTQATTGGSVTVAAVTAGRDVLLDGGGTDPNGAVATGTLTATNGDVAVRARDGAGISLAGISAGDDVVLRTTGAVTVSGTVNAGGGTDSAGLGDVLLTTDGVVTLQGQSFDLTGHDVDIVAGSVMTIGAITAAGIASDVRVQSLGVINLGSLTAGRDVLVDGASTVATGLLTAGRDVGARSTGVAARVSIGGASAGDDVVIRANGSILVTGPLSAGGGTDSSATDQAGDLMFGVARSALAGNLDLVGQMVDVRSSNGSIQVMGATNAATDARFQTQATTGGSVTVGAVTAGRDILLDGGPGLGANGAQATGTLTATSGDVAVRARDGSSISLTDVSAGDDVVLRSTGDVRASGAVTTTGQVSIVGLGDKLIDPSESGALTVGGRTFGLSDSDIDIMGNVIGILRTNAAGGVRILVGSGSLAGGASAGTDILIDSTASLTVGDLSATGDIALRSKSGSLTVGNLSAGDDIVLRAALGVTAGMLKVGGSDHLGVGDALFMADPTSLGGSFDLNASTIDVKSGSGPITIAGAQGPGDIRLQTTGGLVTISGAVTAGRDVFADGGSVTAKGGLTAARDVALFGRTGGVAVASVTAGNDFVVRATGDVTASGDLKAGQTPATGGAGERLIAAGSGSATLFGEAADAGVGVIDLRGANITLSGAVTTDGGAHLRLQSTGATTLGAATVAGDISIDAAGDLTAGDLTAGRDVALRSSAGGVSIASAKAGDDIVLRAVGAIAVTGQLSAGGGADAAGAGDGLFSLNPTSLGGDFDLAGGNVDLKSDTGGISALGAISAPTDVRLQAARAIAVGSVTAGRDLLLDGGSVSGADLHAGRDVAVRAQTDSVTLASIAAGDDVVLRAAKDVTVSGAISAGGAADSDGAGDRLFATDKTALNGDFDLAGGNIDVRAHGAIKVGGQAAATGDARFQTLDAGAISLAAVTAGGDVLADGAAVQASGALLANRDVAVRGRTGVVQLATIKAGDDIAIRAGGDVSVAGTLSSGSASSATGAADRLISAAESGPIMRLVDPLAATASIEGFTLANGDIDIKSGGAISLNGDVNAAGSASGLHLQAAGKISAGSVTAGDSIFARGRDFALSGAWRANTVRLEVTASGGLALGEGVSATAGGVALSSSSIGLIDAPTLQIFLGDTSGSKRGAALSIGNLNIDVAKIKTSLELYAGAASQVVISGAFAPSAGGANSTMVRIGAPNADVGDWTPGSIRVIANSGGSIGVSTTVTGRTFSDIRAFGSVELNATNDILIGYQDFIDKLSATSAAGVSQAVKALLAPQTVGGQRMLITAGTLTLRANGKVAQQDTEGLLGNNPTGLYLFGGSATAPQLVLGRTSGKSVGALTLPDFIELNGAVTTGTTILTGPNASLASGIAFANGVAPSAYYRLNSCAIMQPGSCTSSSVHSSVSISPDQLTNLTVQDRTAAAGTADPTVASATNEESWKDPK